ncbi:MAG: hypothetical protein WAM73_10140, partial [Desulfobacterales bacterium]
LGLSISYGIVKDCGGDIKAASREDEGAIFYVTFPIAPGRKDIAAADRHQQQKPAGPKTGVGLTV